jgi:hypothetical protein
MWCERTGPPQRRALSDCNCPGVSDPPSGVTFRAAQGPLMPRISQLMIPTATYVVELLLLETNSSRSSIAAVGRKTLPKPLAVIITPPPGCSWTYQSIDASPVSSVTTRPVDRRKRSGDALANPPVAIWKPARRDRRNFLRAHAFLYGNRSCCTVPDSG